MLPPTPGQPSVAARLSVAAGELLDAAVGTLRRVMAGADDRLAFRAASEVVKLHVAHLRHADAWHSIVRIRAAAEAAEAAASNRASRATSVESAADGRSPHSASPP